jgi:hypothetical protein
VNGSGSALSVGHWRHACLRAGLATKDPETAKVTLERILHDLRRTAAHAFRRAGVSEVEIAKEKASHKIDVVVALAQACLAGVEGAAGRGPLLFGSDRNYRLDRDDETQVEVPDPADAADVDAILELPGRCWMPGLGRPVTRKRRAGPRPGPVHQPTAAVKYRFTNRVATAKFAARERRMNGYNFADDVRAALRMAREEAVRLGHQYVGTEHLLLGVIREGRGAATTVLTTLNVDFQQIQQKIEATAKGPVAKRGNVAVPPDLDLPYTSRARYVIELSMSEARELRYSYIDTGVLLLGLLREEKGIAAQVLTEAGVTLERARVEAVRLSGGEPLSGTVPPGRAVGYNFTDRVRKILQMAREEAARLRHDHVGTEHVLLGLVREGEGVAGAVITNLNVELEEIKQRIERKVIKGEAARAAGPDLPYTRAAKKVLEMAMSETRELKHSYVGTEHLLLGLLREGKGIAAEVLTELGVTLGKARAETVRLLASEMPSATQQDRRAEILARMRTLAGELLDAPTPDPGRLGRVATELNSLLDELGRMW